MGEADETRARTPENGGSVGIAGPSRCPSCGGPRDQHGTLHHYVECSTFVRVGTMLYGHCGGWFGRDTYGPKRVEACGADWVVAREVGGGKVLFADCQPDRLTSYQAVLDGD